MSQILRRHRLVNRQFFDPTNEEHVDSLKVFLRTGNWGDIQFHDELPYIDVPMTVMMKYMRHQLNVTPETADEQRARFAANPRLTGAIS